MNQNNLLNAIRQRVCEHFNDGKVGMLAAQTGVPEYVLTAWRQNIVDVPSADQIDRLRLHFERIDSPSTDVDSVDRDDPDFNPSGTLL